MCHGAGEDKSYQIGREKVRTHAHNPQSPGTVGPGMGASAKISPHRPEHYATVLQVPCKEAEKLLAMAGTGIRRKTKEYFEKQVCPKGR